MYFLERKEPATRPCIIGNHPYPLPTYRWKSIATCAERGPLEIVLKTMNPDTHRIISNRPEPTP